MKTRLLSAFLAVLLLSAVACGPAVVHSTEERSTSSEVADSDLTRQAAGNTAFALDLYQVLREEEGNLFC